MNPTRNATVSPIALWRPPDELRSKLIDLRTDMVDKMVRRGAIEPAHLPVIAGIAAALRVLDHSADVAASVEIDDSGGLIKLIVYRDGSAIVATELLPTAAIRLGGELLACAGEHLADALAELRAKASR